MTRWSTAESLLTCLGHSLPYTIYRLAIFGGSVADGHFNVVLIGSRQSNDMHKSKIAYSYFGFDLSSCRALVLGSFAKCRSVPLV